MKNLERGLYLFGVYLSAVENAILAGGDIQGESEPRYWSFVELYGKPSKNEFKSELGENAGEAEWVRRNALVALANEARAILKGLLEGVRSRQRASAELERVKQRLDQLTLLWPVAGDAAIQGWSGRKAVEEAADAAGVGYEEMVARLKVKALNGWQPLADVDVIAEIDKLLGLPSLPVDTEPADFGVSGDAVLAFVQKHWKVGAVGLGLLLLLRK